MSYSICSSWPRSLCTSSSEVTKVHTPMDFRNLRASCACANLSMLRCSTELPAHRGRPVVFGGNMSVLHHLGEDGISGSSPAPPGRKYCYLHLIFRRCCLKHSNFAPNSLLLNILPTSSMGSIFCGDFRLSPPVFSIFYGQGGEGEGGAPLMKFLDGPPRCHQPSKNFLTAGHP